MGWSMEPLGRLLKTPKFEVCNSSWSFLIKELSPSYIASLRRWEVNVTEFFGSSEVICRCKNSELSLLCSTAVAGRSTHPLSIKC